MLNVGESQSILIWVRVKNDTILLIAFWLESELKMKWFCRFCWFSRFGWFCCDDSVYFADFQKTWCLTFFPSKYFNSQHFPNRLVEALSARYDIWTGIFCTLQHCLINFHLKWKKSNQMSLLLIMSSIWITNNICFRYK